MKLKITQPIGTLDVTWPDGSEERICCMLDPGCTVDIPGNHEVEDNSWKLKLVEEINDLKQQRRDLICELSQCHSLFRTADDRIADGPRVEQLRTPIHAGLTLTEEYYKRMPMPDAIAQKERMQAISEYRRVRHG
jgi:hypothetical protein